MESTRDQVSRQCRGQVLVERCRRCACLGCRYGHFRSWTVDRGSKAGIDGRVVEEQGRSNYETRGRQGMASVVTAQPAAETSQDGHVVCIVHRRRSPIA